MANVTYLIGAGASAGKRDEKGNITEGLPCVYEIPSRILNIINILKKYTIPDNFWNQPLLNLGTKADWEKAQKELLSLFIQLHMRCLEHATIDTYAKKLKLRGNIQEFKHLEQILTLFFLFEQITSKPDSRYDTFLANILETKFHLPKHIKILSWNYDSQIELAYSEYNQQNDLLIGSKRDIYAQDWEIIKINGTATFHQQNHSLAHIRKELLQELQKVKNDPISVHVAEMRVYLQYFIYLYKLYLAGRKDNTNLSFSFDYDFPSDCVFQYINGIIGKTDALVIIGYTFPFFNRDIDRKMLQDIQPDTKIYIQDLNPERIKQSLMAVLPDFPEEQIFLKKDVDQFFLPPEL